MVSVEAAFAIAAIVSVLVLGIGAVLGVSAHVRCVDAARETARVAAQGDSVRAMTVGRSVAPGGADISIRSDADRVVVTVRAELALLPGVDLGATAVAALEPMAPADP
ncbi:MAG: pilus assembly protein TadE [Williamsia sp.]|nr:pilus assembly protein TadE [Williamsia sp.]